MRQRLVFASLFLTLVSLTSQAGAKDDFIKAVMNQCKKSEADAKALATPGRSGNVVKLKTCTSATITVGDCTLNCKDASSSIGG
ncbi:MAG: hypothetical protein CME69_09190 [Halobacteriovorax sp.]|nr:hypothetical protein [Halobacteriovorax sp.]|tara:strand:+ start:2395 stop:2646 length:252 start_codon:yes stop_codon:yes gene_type:complete